MKTSYKLTSIALIALFSAFVTIAFYRYNFQGAFSSLNEHWGTFGDYVGGVLNPILSFLALLALLYTINLQIADHRLLKKQATKEDVFRMMEALFAGIESLVSKGNTNEIEFYDNNERKHKSNFYSLFSELKHTGLYELLAEANSGAGRKNRQILKPLSERIIFLHNFIHKFERLNGDKQLSEFYKSMLSGISRNLADKGYIPKEVGHFFSTEQSST